MTNKNLGRVTPPGLTKKAKTEEKTKSFFSREAQQLINQLSFKPFCLDASQIKALPNEPGRRLYESLLAPGKGCEPFNVKLIHRRLSLLP